MKIYMEDMQLVQCQATIVQIGEREINKKRYTSVQLDQTIFHPKGGGQPHDEGTINSIPLQYVHKELLDKSRFDLFEVLHCFDPETKLPFKVGDAVSLVVDDKKRALYSRMHTGGHLLAFVVQLLYPDLEPFHGNHDPNDGYVKFKMKNSSAVYEKESLIRNVQPALVQWVEKDLPVQVIKQAGGMRAIQIGESIMTCGGTHVAHLKELKTITLFDLSTNKKEQTVTLKYK